MYDDVEVIMLREIKEKTIEAERRWGQRRAPIQVKSLIQHLTTEIQGCIDGGDWDFAVRLSSYRHEFAKIYSSLDWYEPFLEIRKVRDTITILK